MTSISRNRGTNEERAEKYLTFITDVYLRIKKSDVFKITRIVRQHHVRTSTPSAMLKTGILEREKGTYKWVARFPDIKMAKKLIEDVTEHNRTTRKQDDIEDIKQTVKPILPVVVSSADIANLENQIASLHQKIDALSEIWD